MATVPSNYILHNGFWYAPDGTGPYYFDSTGTAILLSSLTAVGQTNLLVDGNNLYSGRYDWFDWQGGTDHTSWCTNRVTSDPSTELGHVPPANDGTFNYAQLASFGAWSGTPSLASGSGLAG